MNIMLAPPLAPGILIGTALSVFFIQMSIIRQWDALSSLTGLPGLDPDDPRALSFLHVTPAFLRGHAGCARAID